jgi:hypothetical protein
MPRPRELLAGVTILMGSHGVMPGLVREGGAPRPFGVARVHFEQNATDKDVEVVFEVEGGDEGLARLTVVAPDGRTVIAFTAPGDASLGIRQFRLESPEPREAARLKAAYPEGVYTFTGATAAGDPLRSESRLTHTLPAPASLLRPGAAARGVGTEDLEITWAPGKDLAAYIVRIDQHELGVDISATLPSSAATFAVPNGVLRPGTTYLLSLGTVAGEGNTSFVETTFTTAGKNERARDSADEEEK